MNQQRLQVASARPEDSNQGLARLPQLAMATLGLSQGDVAEIVGKRKIAARAIFLYKGDEGLDVVRLDGVLRVNPGVGSGEYVELRKAESKPV